VTMWITVDVVVLAQIAVTLRSDSSPRFLRAFNLEIRRFLRIYAITDRNKLFGGMLSTMILAQLSFGVYLIVGDAIGPGEFLKLFFFHSSRRFIGS
jgi:hypothetical protein